MNHDDITEYFNEILKNEGYISADSLDILKKLINLTIKFRDKLISETGEILTVGDTRRAIEIYLSAIKTGYVPPEDNRTISALVKFWLKEINDVSF